MEFTDGTTWGADRCQCAEFLKGERAGGSEAAKKLLQVLAESGPEEVLKVARKGMHDLAPPDEKSPVWKKGFEAGVRTIIYRVNQAETEWGLTEIETALRRPFDALEVK